MRRHRKIAPGVKEHHVLRGKLVPKLMPSLFRNKLYQTKSTAAGMAKNFNVEGCIRQT